MSKIEAVPYNAAAGVNPNAVPANGRNGVLLGYVPYISWTDGAPDVEDTSVSDGNEEAPEGGVPEVSEPVAKRGPGRPKKDS